MGRLSRITLCANVITRVLISGRQEDEGWRETEKENRRGRKREGAERKRLEGATLLAGTKSQGMRVPPEARKV